jgi:hypothetical protein
MNKKMYAIALTIFMVLPLLAAAATLNARATSGPTISLIDTSPGVTQQAHTYFYLRAGGTINLTLYITGITSLWSWKVNVTWNNAILQLTPTGSVTEGPFLSSNGASTTMFIEQPPTAGNIGALYSMLLVNSSVSGSGALAYIAFTPQTLGVNATIQITDIELLNPAGNQIATVGPVSTTITVRLVGDVNGDNLVNMKDIALVARAFGMTTSSPNWNPANDLNYDGVINMKDIALVARAFGTHYP